jgi:hypothetical protein
VVSDNGTMRSFDLDFKASDPDSLIRGIRGLFLLCDFHSFFSFFFFSLRITCINRSNINRSFFL